MNNTSKKADNAHITPEYLESLACTLIEQWELDGWSFAWNTNKTRIGVCRFGPNRIELSRFRYDNTQQSDLHLLVDTVKHEIAHALAGPRAGHGPVWKKWAVKVGAVPKARKRLMEKNPYKDVKWLLVDGSNNDKVVARYYRKPPAHRFKAVKGFRVTGRPQSLGKLRYVEV